MCGRFCCICSDVRGHHGSKPRSTMSIQLTEEEKVQTLSFLSQFVAHQPDPFEADAPLPLRVVPRSISLDELEGECIEWCLQYLSKR